MKQLMRKLGFRKMDEMEQHIAFRAQRNAYVFLIAALLAWSLWESHQVFAHQTRLNLLPSMLLCAACLVQTTSQLMLSRRAVKDDEDARETSSSGWVLGLCMIGATLTIAAVVVMLTMGKGA